MDFSHNHLQCPMAIIKREKLNGFGYHMGVLRPDGLVFHTTNIYGTHLTNFEGFAMGRKVEIVEEIPIYKQAEIYARMHYELLMQKAYDLATNNCEIVANRVVGNPAESKQFNSLLAITTLLGLALLLSNS